MAEYDFGFPTPDAPEAAGGASSAEPTFLSADSPDPLNVQLSEIMRGKIRNREWRRGRYIPSEADLMAQYGVSPQGERDRGGGRRHCSAGQRAVV